LWLALSTAACSPPETIDASVPPDGGSSELGAAPDGGARLSSAFTIIGCTTLDTSTDVPRCSGPAPLDLTFVPISAGVDTFVWTFAGGDPGSSQLITPTVRWTKAGQYTVQLAAGGPGGTIIAASTIRVTAGGTGDPCSDSSDCDVAAGLSCLCAGEGCPGGLAVGLCTRACTGGGCAPGEVCADLERGGGAPPDLGPPDPDAGAADGGNPNVWRRALCLRTCAAAADCRTGLACREVPALASGAAAGGAFTWRQACFADVLGDVGDACRGPDGLVANDRCLSGRCDPLGARGLCTSSCSVTQLCPAVASCATFTGAPQGTCLRRCDATHPCTDPLLACQEPDPSGTLGFTVLPGDPAHTQYCSPRRCTTPVDCDPAGTCSPLGGASFCTAS
jgi:PKD repeat protein